MNRTLNADDILSAFWERYRVTLQIRERIVGGVPKNPEVIEKWLEVALREPTARIQTLIGVTAAALNHTKPDVETAVAQTKEAMGVASPTAEMIAELSECMWTGFKSDANGLYIEGRQIKAMLKEAANIVKEKLDMTAFKARIAERVFVEDLCVPLGRMEPDGWEERPIHIMTAQGPRSALKRFDYVERPTIVFTIKAYAEALKTKDKNVLPVADTLRVLLELGQEIGLGADRSQGAGAFDLVSIEPFRSTDAIESAEAA